jgi:hypothetical protein
MTIEAMKQALEALEMLARYENPETKIQVRKPKDGGPIVTMYPHKVATDAGVALRTAISEAEKQEPVTQCSYPRCQTSAGCSGVCSKTFLTAPPQRQPHELLCVCGATWCINADGGEELVATPPAAQRNKVASWMMAQGYATGHGDTTEDLLKELEWQVRESERDACAAIARQWDVDHPASNYGGCIARLIEARGQT